ncbi:MAG: cryptochrome/photolyase family protein [Aquisalinus sp.]|nr:cryptochrome/photolyase family protein [Aquisalinus sp.]
MPSLRLILGDQLTRSITSLEDYQDGDLILMAEVKSEATYVKHHKQKILFLFSAMRHFAQALEEDGLNVTYIQYDDPENAGSLGGEIDKVLQKKAFDRLIVTECGEWRLSEEIKTWERRFDLDIEIREDKRFICTLPEFNKWAVERKALRMEYFYREMRQKTGLLMNGDEPAGKQWNFDADNRKKLPKDYSLPVRPEIKQTDIIRSVIKLVEEHFSDHFGNAEMCHYAVTRDGALRELDWFVEEALPNFGDYQDAMATGEDFLHHSKLSAYLNAGLLTAMEVCRAAEEAWEEGRAPLNAVEGFIRQIIGWREYVRGLYWREMPDYAKLNFFGAKKALPDFYWTGDTKMHCISEAVRNTRDHAYAHHIQRLMITGNFALLAGISPDAINEWYLIVYADAYEWVELPNTHGMAIYADGGVMASKPYAASGSYINRMSNYCKSCSYKVTGKTGDDACPFNYLYWNFIEENRDKLEGNGRMGLVFKNLDRKSEDERKDIKQSARKFLQSIA